MNEAIERTVAQLPPSGQKIRVIFDTDIDNEIDDLYAIALAMFSPDRFVIEGFSAAHFAQREGSDSIERSYALLQQMIEVAGVCSAVPIVRGSHPMRYSDDICASDGARLIIERAHADADGPLWVVGLGAASTLTAALLIDPSIAPKVRYLYHARSEHTWPTHCDQFNVYGDIWAARNLLTSNVPLVWFDTGAQLVCSMQTTEERLAPLGKMGAFLHEYRFRNEYYQRSDKGFFDVGDIAWMIDPALCASEIIDVPYMDFAMRFQRRDNLGQMLRVSQVQPEPTWELFFARMQAAAGS